jgi:hypothetical protein
MITNAPASCQKVSFVAGKKLFLGGLLFYCVLCVSASLLQAGYVYPFEVITNNGIYYNSGDFDIYVEVTNEETGQVDFTFYNESLFNSSIARIYFSENSLLDVAGIIEGDGTSFNQPATPGSLPGGRALEPSFVAIEEFSFSGGSPKPKNGINPGEWVQITFDLTSGGTFGEVIDKLNTAAFRLGVHVIALPDGSSESAVTVPEPATICLLGLGSLTLLRKRRVQINHICRERTLHKKR